MSWFNKKKPEMLIPSLPPEHQASIEIVAHKDASKEVAEEAKKANEVVQKLFLNNGFHVKLYVAAGGKTNRLAKGHK